VKARVTFPVQHNGQRLVVDEIVSSDEEYGVKGRKAKLDFDGLVARGNIEIIEPVEVVPVDPAGLSTTKETTP
jgi:hypothetical protein